MFCNFILSPVSENHVLPETGTETAMAKSAPATSSFWEKERTGRILWCGPLSG
jgi:hypothetical protein